jgi:fatty-acyl-CoA synthase
MDLSSLRYAICGASPMPMEVFRKFERISGVKILEGYGLTEGTCVSCLNPKDGERRVGSIGFRLPYQSMKVARLDEKGCFSDECAPNEIGSVLIKGPNVIPGYKSEKDNEGLWAEEGWLNTGDLGRKDEDGYFWLAGRTKDLIIRGGHNIDSSIIEEALHKHPDVVMAAAVGKPDSYAGELPVAYVVLSPNAGTTEDDLKAHLRTVISERAALPKDITLLDAMPQTAVGKVFKPELRWRAAQKVFSQALTFLTEENVKFEVKVGADDTHGTLAVISLTEIDPLKRTSLESRISRILNTFALSFRIR